VFKNLLSDHELILVLFKLLICSGSDSAVKEPGHFEVRKSSSQVTRCTFFLKKVDDLLLVVALKTQAANTISPSK